MRDLRGLGVAILIGGALFARPAAAQIRGAQSSLVHVVSVTVPARVKVKVSPVAVTVNSNRAWVLSASAPAGSSRGAKAQWSGTHTDTTVFFRGAKTAALASGLPVVLTVSAP